MAFYGKILSAPKKALFPGKYKTIPLPFSIQKIIHL